MNQRLLAVFLLAIACGSDGDDAAKPADDAETTTVTQSPPELEPAVRAYAAAFLGGDADTAYGLLTQRCRDARARTEFVDAVMVLSEQYGKAQIVSYDGTVDGDTAVATYRFTDPELNQRERWIVEDGGWRNDDC